MMMITTRATTAIDAHAASNWSIAAIRPVKSKRPRMSAAVAAIPQAKCQNAPTISRVLIRRSGRFEIRNGRP